jgi:hypothetical protein
MPANLTPQYIEAEEAYKRATTVEERIAAVEEMLRAIPKHKGTEKMQADLRKRLARLRVEGREARKKGMSDPYRVEREGAGQVFVVGPPNSGKSSLGRTARTFPDRPRRRQEMSLLPCVSPSTKLLSSCCLYNTASR